MNEMTDTVLDTLVSDDLSRSGLEIKDIDGLRRIYQDDDYAAGGYTIPYFTLDGQPIMDSGKPFARVRLVGRKSKDVPRYRSPKGSSNHVFIPPELLSLLQKKAAQNAALNEIKGSTTTTLFVTEEEKKAIRAVKAGIPAIAIPGIQMWADSQTVRDIKLAFLKVGGNLKEFRLSEDTPINPELLDAITQIKANCPDLGVVCILFDADGKPLSHKEAFKKVKGEEIPVGGVDWKTCPAAGGGMVSANPQVTSAGYKLAAALRKQSTVRCAVVARFCEWNQSDDEAWRKQGLDDWLEASSEDGVKAALGWMLESAIHLWNVIKNELLFSASADPDRLGVKGGPSAEIAFSRLLNGEVVGKADGLLYEWVGSHWQIINHLRLEDAAHLVMDAFYAETGSARKIVDAPKAAVSAPHLYKIPDTRKWQEVGGAIIPCADVTLDISPKGVVTARKPAKGDGLRYCINANWADRNKPRPEFDRFIQSTLPDPEVRRIVQQYVGYTLISDTRFQVAQWWFGSGSNGKGFLAQIVSALHRKVAAANIEDLGGFGAESLIDASLITVDETPRRIDEQRLKSAISGDDISINRKYNTPVTVRLGGKWLLRGNDKPALSDQSDGLWRRLQIIEFLQKFKGDNQDDMLATRIIEHELSGVLHWAVEGLVMLLRAGGFKDIPESVQAAKQNMQAETDNVLGWWTDLGVQVTEHPRIDKAGVYGDYSGWCKENGLFPISSINFWKRVRAIIGRNCPGVDLNILNSRETISDPLTGETKQKWVRKVNLDLYPEVQGTSTNVVPLHPQHAAVENVSAKDQDPLVPFVELGDDDILF